MLRVKFPVTQWPGWNIPELCLTGTAAAEVTVIVDPASTADYGSDSPVFRGFGSLQGSETVLALKFAMREDLIDALKEESRVYSGALHSLQGSVIPRCFGLYVGVGEEDQQIGCLVLEHFGECIQQPFSFLPLDLKIRIMDSIASIHRQGLLHGDFAERNVLVQDGDVRIIDFDQTEWGHDCPVLNFCPEDHLPDISDLRCNYLLDVIEKLEIFSSGT
ncbi:hypothetical protein FB45DRAFT_913289 [Roridomyces roridus]|uniref:non-specific serine/threonine protein kinase n=1 Tax=Roridomyces roridus TaxID=1738132 RepID=A0AAD7FQ15_9AGAR|nr:hypothetical protein FB45DRAFT_913289 [Roridomyces roridus]